MLKVAKDCATNASLLLICRGGWPIIFCITPATPSSLALDIYSSFLLFRAHQVQTLDSSNLKETSLPTLPAAV